MFDKLSAGRAEVRADLSAQGSILGVGPSPKTVRIVFCRIRNHSQRLLYAFASTSVKKVRSTPSYSLSLLELTFLGWNGAKRNGGRAATRSPEMAFVSGIGDMDH